MQMQKLYGHDFLGTMCKDLGSKAKERREGQYTNAVQPSKCIWKECGRQNDTIQPSMRCYSMVCSSKTASTNIYTVFPAMPKMDQWSVDIAVRKLKAAKVPAAT